MNQNSIIYVCYGASCQLLKFVCCFNLFLPILSILFYFILSICLFFHHIMLFIILFYQMIKVVVLISLCSMAAMCYAQPAWLCRDCVVNGTRYRGNRAFQYNLDCNQYTCKCLCDGTYDCPPALTKNLCRVETEEGCRVCEAQDNIYAPGPFKFAYGCHLYDCDCNCDGSWHCPQERALNLCWFIRSNPNKQ